MRSKKTNKKGFTLVELLAVIVILAVIALIVAPVVTGAIQMAKEQADLRSAEGYIKAAENYYAASIIDDSKKPFIGKNIFNKVEISNNKATNGKIIVDENGLVSMSIVIGNKCYNKTFSGTIKDITITDDIANCGVKTVTSVLPTDLTLAEAGGCATPNANNYTYMGGCYIKGTPTNNYVWYSGFLWRIMGINSNGTIRLITEDALTNITYESGDSTFSSSYVNKWLKEYFLPNFKGSVNLKDGEWCDRGSNYVGNANSVSTTCLGTKIIQKIGLISLDEYNLAGKNNSYLNNGINYWTLTSGSSSIQVWRVDNDGTNVVSIIQQMSTSNETKNVIGIRPVINVASDVAIEAGNGVLSSTWTEDNSPYILESDKLSNQTGTIGDFATSGEYVKLNNKMYRVISKDSNGIKMILDGYQSGEVTYKNLFTTATTDTYAVNLVGADNLSKLVRSTYYKGPSLYQAKAYYEVLLSTNGAYTSYVGIPRYGEMLSAQSSTIFTLNNTVASSNANAKPYWISGDFSSDQGIKINSTVNLGNGYSSSTNVIRPVIVVNLTTPITAGVGTPSNPYQI